MHGASDSKHSRTRRFFTTRVLIVLLVGVAVLAVALM
jgi:hypothetical protein